MEIQDVQFKPKAYRRAAQSIESLSTDIAQIEEKEGLASIPGVGAHIAEKIHEYLAVGRLRYLEKLRKETPINVAEMFSIEGIGPKRAKLLYTKLGIKDKKSLLRHAGKLEGVLGKKEAHNILSALEQSKQYGKRMLLNQAYSVAWETVEYLKKNALVLNIEPAGSLRRGLETVGDIDILCTTKEPSAVMSAFVKMPNVRNVIAHGETKSAVKLESGVQVDLRVIDPKSWGSALMYFTGSKQHNIILRKIAMSKGWKLSEYGLFDRKNKSLSSKTETSVYQKMGMQYMPPEMREAQGEIDIALKNNIPELVLVKDIQGELHCHTKWSDGTRSILEMAEAALVRGRKYLVISDHTGVLKIAGGLNPKQFEKQWQEISAMQKKVPGIRLLKGCEANILENGSIDVPDAVLSKMDVVTASVHFGFKSDSVKTTKRIVKAMENPHVDVIGHLSARLINRREPIKYDFGELLDAAKQNGTVFEVNSQPDRLDIKDNEIREAVRHGVKIAVTTDAHMPEHFDNLKYGVLTARRGWATKRDVVNAMSCERILDYFGD